MFTHLHLHTQYSLLEGAIRIKSLVTALQEKGFTACAITDHGNMFGAVEFYHALKGAGLKPLIGLGAAVIEGEFPDAKNDSGRADVSGGKTQFICQNQQGYHNLSYLASISFTEGKIGGFPFLNHNLLEQYHNGLIAFSGGLDGEISRYLLNDNWEDAQRTALWYRDVFADRFYLELQNTGLEGQFDLNKKIVRLAHETKIRLVGTNDCFYLTSEEAEAQYILALMGEQKRVTDEGVWKQKGNQRFLRSPEEMEAAFAELPAAALENTGKIAEQCELALEKRKDFLPNFEIPQEHTLDSWLRQESRKGLDARLEQLYTLYAPEKTPEEFRKDYDERLDFELDVIIQMGFPGYFLIVADFIKAAKDGISLSGEDTSVKVSVGPGRGSGAGSLVAYALRITDVDPLRYGLLFERFLNPDRISMPDFDIDFDVDGRDKVIEYVRQKYGERNVCQIATFGSLKAKAVVRGVARVLNFPYSEADKIAKLIPNDLNITLDEALQKDPELALLAAEGSENEQRLIQLSLQLENLNTNLGTHAAGVIIMDQDIREVMPVCEGKDGTLLSMYPMKYAEDQGAVKFDFLGLKNISIIDNTLELLRSSHPDEPELEISKIPMDDQKTFDLLCRAETGGVFQLESSGMKRLAAKMKPDVFEDIVAILALYRPGPLESGMVDDYVECKHGRQRVNYPHSLLKSILQETNGVMVYQEQIMQAVQVLAGFSLGQADLLRRAIGKKNAEILLEQRSKFVEGCLRNPQFTEQCRQGETPENTANEIFDLIDKFARYGFNKSHSVAYGMITYQTAYLKAHYPVQFMAALLNRSFKNQDNVIQYISECKAMGIQVLPPDVNHSLKTFNVVPSSKHLAADAPAKREVIRFGLSAVKSVGGKAVDAILKVRNEYGQLTDFIEFMKKVDLAEVNKRMLETLVKCGAFDSLHENRAQLFAVLENAFHLAQEFHRAEDEGQNSLFDLLDEADVKATETKLEFPQIKDWPKKERLKQEKEAIGFYVSGHPLDCYASEIKRFATTSVELKEIPAPKSGDDANGNYSGKFTEKKQISLAGIIVKNTVRMNASSAKFAIVVLEDMWGTVEFPVFAGVYEKSGELLESDEPLLISGRVNHRDNEVSLFADSVRRLSEIREKEAQNMTIEIAEAEAPAAEVLTPENLQKLRNILQKYSGDKPFVFKVQAPEKTTVIITPEERLNFPPALIEELEELLKHQQLSFGY